MKRKPLIDEMRTLYNDYGQAVFWLQTIIEDHGKGNIKLGDWLKGEIEQFLKEAIDSKTGE